MERNFKEGNIPVCGIDVGIVFQISETKFLKGEENVKTHFNTRAFWAFRPNK